MASNIVGSHIIRFEEVIELKWKAYFRLMRFHKPVGILLLWIPTAWALWIANQGSPAVVLNIYFMLGTILMRAAGCVVNDIADRHIDKHVIRTSLRPLTTGEVSLFEAFMLLALLLLAALYIVMQLPILCLPYAVIAILITVLYPFCKRFIRAPQLVLGLAFSMGIPMANVASGGSFNMEIIVLFILNFAWIVSYDTMYAMADKDDDLRIGVNSTAVLFGPYDRFIILILQVFFHGLWFYLAHMLGKGAWFYGCWTAAFAILGYQQLLLSKRDVSSYLSAFNSNVWYGLLMWYALAFR